MLKNDTLKNGTPRISLYGSAPPGVPHIVEQFKTVSHAVSTQSNQKIFNMLAASPTIENKGIQLCCFAGEFLEKKFPYHQLLNVTRPPCIMCAQYIGGIP